MWNKLENMDDQQHRGQFKRIAPVIAQIAFEIAVANMCLYRTIGEKDPIAYRESCKNVSNTVFSAHMADLKEILAYNQGLPVTCYDGIAGLTKYFTDLSEMLKDPVIISALYFGINSVVQAALHEGEP